MQYGDRPDHTRLAAALGIRRGRPLLRRPAGAVSGARHRRHRRRLAGTQLSHRRYKGRAGRKKQRDQRRGKACRHRRQRRYGHRLRRHRAAAGGKERDAAGPPSAAGEHAEGLAVSLRRGKGGLRSGGGRRAFWIGSPALRHRRHKAPSRRTGSAPCLGDQNRGGSPGDPR